MAVKSKKHVHQKFATHHKNVTKFVKGKKKMSHVARSKSVGKRTFGSRTHKNTRSFTQP